MMSRPLQVRDIYDNNGSGYITNSDFTFLWLNFKSTIYVVLEYFHVFFYLTCKCVTFEFFCFDWEFVMSLVYSTLCTKSLHLKYLQFCDHTRQFDIFMHWLWIYVVIAFAFETLFVGRM